MTSESPSSRNVRLTPPGSSSGSVPFQLISKRLPLLRRAMNAKRLQRLARHDPRADRGRKGLGLERAQRHIFPLLDVARAPVVEDDKAENHLFGLLLVKHLADR